MIGTVMHQVHDHNQASNQDCEEQESNYSIDTTAQCLSFGGLRNIALHNDSAFLIKFEVIIVIVIFFYGWVLQLILFTYWLCYTSLLALSREISSQTRLKRPFLHKRG